MRAHLDAKVEIARRAATPCTTLPADADARAVGDPGRNLDGEPLPLLDRARSTAARAAAQPLSPGSLALRARRRTTHGDGELRAAKGVHEVDLDGVLEILATRRRRLARAHAAEHLVDEVGEGALFVRLATRTVRSPTRSSTASFVATPVAIVLETGAPAATHRSGSIQPASRATIRRASLRSTVWEPSSTPPDASLPAVSVGCPIGHRARS